MSNFFAALDSESDDDVKQVSKGKAVQPKKVKNQKKAPKAVPEEKPVAKPSNENKRGQERGNRNDNKKRTGRGGKREYDRRSGTGRGREIKKGGAGGHNWGKAGDENAAPPADDVEKEVGEEGVEEEAEPEAVEKTLDEYFAEKAALRQGDAFEDLGDVEVEDVKEGKQYAKKDKATLEETDAFMANKYSKQKRNKARKDKPKQVETGFYVKDKTTEYESRPYRGRGGRGRRGGPGPGPGRGRGGRGGSSRSFVDSNNVAAFPALGAASN